MAELVLPTPKRAQRFFFSQQEVRVILSAADEPYRTFYGLLAETGMRVGELCGLCVEDLDLVRGLLQVRQSAVRGKLGDPKTDESIRVIEIVTARRGTFENLPAVMAAKRTAIAFRHPQRHAVGSEFGSKAEIQAVAAQARNQGSEGQWVPCFPPRQRHNDEQLRSAVEVAPAEARPCGWVAGYRDDLHARDQRGWKALRCETWKGRVGSFGRQLDAERKSGS